MSLSGGRVADEELRSGVTGSRREPTGRPNVLFVLADDVGVDQLACYDDCNDWVGYVYTNTPTINALAAAGMRFRRAVAAPICSPARALALTGRLPSKTGISAVINTGSATKLGVEEQTFWDLIETARPTNLRKAHYGKWHLAAGEADYASVIPQGGFDDYIGCPTNPQNDSSTGYGGTSVGTGVLAGTAGSWMETDNGAALTVENGYITTEEADDVVNIVGVSPTKGTPPWLVSWWAHSTHVPFHWAPTTLHSYGAAPTWTDIGALGAHQTMLEAFDTELGRVLEAIWDTNTFVIFAADNGSVQFLVDTTAGIHDPGGTGQPIPPASSYDVEHFKATSYWQGVNVPLIVKGPGIQPGSVCDSLVSIGDIFATISELVVGPNWEEHKVADDVVSRSIVRCFNNPAYKPHQGEHVWAGSWYEPGMPLSSESIYQLWGSVQHGDHGFRLVISKGSASSPIVQEWFEWGVDPSSPVDQHEQSPLDPASVEPEKYRAALAFLEAEFGLKLPDLSV